ncbi:DUF1853 family protein [Neptuniibacter sp. QD34_54]|uniref:DUF1853 family protein n=1 Tax=Neptuniibacter sp. QD34_54 TaxID=3398208 RepID=UPI0039F528F0
MENDIDWVFNSPSLINTPKSLTSFQDLLEHDKSKSVAINCSTFIARNLGGYYENIVNFILKNDIYLTDIKRNIKIFKDRRTLGEFDFIGRSLTGDFHLECAIKYYLRVGSGTKLHNFIGPGKRDRLDIKYEKMIEHQLKLSKTTQGIHACKSEGLSPSIFVMLVQGYLFHPFAEFGTRTEFHPAINPSHLQGWWLRQNALSHINDSDFYTIMIKPHWLIADQSNLLDYAELKTELSKADRPILVARLDKTGKELDRGFVVPDDW